MKRSINYAYRYSYLLVGVALLGSCLHFLLRAQVATVTVTKQDFLLMDRAFAPPVSRNAFAPPVSRNGFVRRDIKPNMHIYIQDYPPRDQELHQERFHDDTEILADKPRVFYYVPVPQSTENPPESGSGSAAIQRPIDPLSEDETSAKTAYHYLRPYEKPYHHQCKNMQNWQSRFYPSCNQMHELDATQDSTSLLSMDGSWRSTWKYKQGDDNIVLKMLQLNREFDHQSYSYHQIDAMALERLTFSKFVVTSFGFCGQSTLVELAPQDARTVIKDESVGSKERLRMARDLSRGLNHIHSIDRSSGKKATLCHNDINVANIVNVNKQTLKFNDFNLAVLLKWNKTKPCGYPVRFRGDLWRSPEEIRNDTYVSEKIDIYSLGNVLFQVLTRHQPWTWLEPEGKLSDDQVAERKLDGKKPNFPDKIIESRKLAQQAMYYGTLACYEPDPTKRPTAHQLAQGFHQALRWVEKKEKKSKEELKNLFVA